MAKVNEAKKPKKDESFKNFVLEQLAELHGVRSRAMFGGWGLYWNDLFFGVVDEGRAYFKTSEETRAPYVEASMSYFEPTPGQGLKNYYEVPLDVLENSSRLMEWAKIAAALSEKKPATKSAAPKKKAAPKRAKASSEE
jgi:DNA transformation protein